MAIRPTRIPNPQSSPTDQHWHTDVHDRLSWLIRRKGFPLRSLHVDGWSVTARFVARSGDVLVQATYFEDSTDEAIAAELIDEAGRAVRGRALRSARSRRP
jgi:hypothetical protein